jgi:putative membrane protein
MMGFGLIGLVIMLMFWGLLIAGAFLLVKYIFPTVKTTNLQRDDRPMEAREILDHRYARGEITREQYLAKMEDLKQIGGLSDKE